MIVAYQMAINRLFNRTLPSIKMFLKKCFSESNFNYLNTVHLYGTTSFLINFIPDLNYLKEFKPAINANKPVIY